MLNHYKNLVLNPRFDWWPFGDTFVSSAHTAARWKAERGTNTATISKGTSNSSTTYDKWLRSRNNLTISVSALTTAADLRILQQIESGQYFGQSRMRMTVVASGPAGESFYFGVDNNYTKITMLGDVGGVPTLATGTLDMAFDDIAADYIELVAFEQPSATGTYRIHYVNLEVYMNESDTVGEFELRPLWVEKQLCSRYITEHGTGLIGMASTTSAIRFPVQAPIGQWRTTPIMAVNGNATSVDAVTMAAGSVKNAATATYTISFNPNANELGAVVVVGGFGGTLTIGDWYMVGTNSGDPIFYLNADYY